MRSKLLGRLISVALSATVALTSGIPALAYDGGGGDLLDDEEEIQLLDEEEEIGSDFDVLEEDIVEEKEFFATEDGETVFESTDDVTITFANTGATSGVAGTATAGTTSHVYVLDPDSLNGMNAFADNGTKNWDSSKDYTFEVIPATGYVIDKTKVAQVTVGYAIDSDNDSEDVANEPAVLDAGFACSLTESKATITVYSNFLKKYKNAVAAVTGTITSKALTVTIGAITKPDSYKIKVVGTSIAASNPLLEVTCGNARTTDTTKTVTDALDLSDFELSSSPITGVKIYTAYGTDDEAEITTTASSKTDVTGTVPFYFDPSNKKLYIGTQLISDGYDAGKDLTVVAISEGFTISQDPSNKAEYGTTLRFALEGATTTYVSSATVTNKDVLVDIVPSTDVTGRKVSSIDYIVTYADGEVFEGTAAAVAGVATIPKAKLTNTNTKKAASIVVSATTTETVDVTTKKGTNTSITAIGDAVAATETETGEDYSFAVKADANFEVSEVGYILGALPVSGDPTVIPLTLSGDGNYTIPGSAVKNKITIVTKAAQATRDVNVSVTIDATDSAAITTDFVVTDKETHTALTTAGVKYATVGSNYDFIISEASHNFSVKSVKYTLGGGTEEHDDVITIDAKKGIYRIAADKITDESAINIIVYSYPMVLVQIPDNAKAILSVNGEAKTADFYVKKGEKFTFSIAGKTSNVKVDKVAYVISGNTTTPDVKIDKIMTFYEALRGCPWFYGDRWIQMD